MTFKTNLDTVLCPALAGFSVVEVQGRDAASFLQAQAMNDVAALTPGRWQWNGLLTAKGRVIALFALANVAPERFLLVLPDLAGADLVAHLQRFVFRSKVSLRDAPGLVAASGPAAATSDVGAIAGDPDHGFALDFSGEGGQRWLWLLPPSHPAIGPSDGAVDAHWRALDIAHGLPRLAGEQREAYTPQMLSLERLGAFSLKKGCYPGQEIVSRTHYLGQAKRVLARLRGLGLAPGQSVEAAGQGVGSLVCIDASGTQALAVLTADADGPLSSGGRPCTRESLLQGLARPS
ncbi:MAG: folate-binding protein [Arenimonas sp.]|uniref:CAF17-like 4Fe-4S cluster assembly/insertion protein YgfZ n=1 Tax=Arenimonas sp. TaxID=1872635 RepID=UPI0025BC8F63|nr:folate-binding protein [Arenimonas sp.]MBW8366494.1 folate-binding protein [Arenimonas sp.]